MKRIAVGITGAALAALLGLVPAGALGQCCGDCNGDGTVTVDEMVSAVNRALTGCQDDGVCTASVATCNAQLSSAQMRLDTCNSSLSSAQENLDTCNASVSNTQGNLDTCNASLSSTQASLATCTESGTTCTTNLTACQTALADCRTQLGGPRFLASGQKTSYGPGTDGDVQAGVPLAYTDNGDGTITDHNTGLMWEKKDDSGGIHDRNNRYLWGLNGPPDTMNGNIVTEFLATLNRAPCFAGHCDWRIPNLRELLSLVDYEVPYPGPVVNAAFHNSAGCKGCTDVTQARCSCTIADIHWTSTTYRYHAGYAWYVGFSGGGVSFDDKTANLYVRAVRGGVLPNPTPVAP